MIVLYFVCDILWTLFGGSRHHFWGIVCVRVVPGTFRTYGFFLPRTCIFCGVGNILIDTVRQIV